jgi:deoxyribonuclease-4
MITFGPSGNGDLFYSSGYKKTIEAPKWLNSLGLSGFEYSCTMGVNVSDEVALAIGEEAKKYNINISVHAPYYINFANVSDDMVEKSYNYVLDSLHVLKLLGGTKLVIHSASCGKLDRSEALDLTAKRLKILMQKVRANKDLDGLYVCPETMGKIAQIGTYKEIIDLCCLDDRLIPTFDFGHINCIMQGGLKTEEDYKNIFNYCFEKLGEYRTKHCHIHFSKIQYGPKGEIRHVTYDNTEFGPDFEPLSKVLKELKIEPSIISESPGTQVEDAIKLMKIYKKCF